MNNLKILTYSTLFPNAIKNRHGVFVESRLRHLVASGKVEVRVVAPVPWFPFKAKYWGRYGEYAQVPSSEERFGIIVTHPCYPLIPKMGLSTAPFLMAAATYPHLKKIITDGFDFDVIDAHFFYPDGVAATLLAKWLKKKVTITARGTDIHTYPNIFMPRLLIKWASRQADHLITVCKALEKELVRLGAPVDNITTLRNGVDLELFRPAENRDKLRNELGLQGKVLLSVGNLIPLKGHDLIIKALARLPKDYNLWIIGEGECEMYLKRVAQDFKVHDKVHFLGGLPQIELRNYYQAADALILASEREGWANVLLEAMACATPVVATNIWGTPEVVCHHDAGLLVEARTPESISFAIQQLFADYPDRLLTREFAEQFGWEATTAGQWQVFCSLVRQPSGGLESSFVKD